MVTINFGAFCDGNGFTPNFSTTYLLVKHSNYFCQQTLSLWVITNKQSKVASMY